MADNGHQDVVNQVQSTDASAPVDVSASTINTHAAAAAGSDALTPNNTETSAPALDKPADHVAPVAQDEKASREGQEDESIQLSTASSLGEVDNAMNATAETNHHGTTNGTSGDVSAPPSVGQSAESDTDISKNDASETTAKGGDIPKYSVKKPSAFKSVSVTKNFLAKAGTPPAQITKPPSETPASSALQSSTLAASTARPRLVAKLASGNKLSLSSHLSNGVNSGRTSGPDPMQVWNRNRVQAPQATPKHLTDEELRQQYGIQLASIPVIDGDDKGNKWADIDDEEDDWAPEVIEWSDGSKVNLAEAEKAAAEQAKAAEESKRREDVVTAQQAAARITPSLGPKATVLKVGSSSAQLKTGVDAAAKPGDRPTLVAKPVAPTPVKSPWAALPPIDKVPPVAVNLQQSAPPMHRSSFAENNVSERGAPGWRAAKEIAADDFSRMHRDAVHGTPRELFNSQSGKYEPVNDARRGSMKRDQAFRQPAVLQRPGPDHDNTAMSSKDLQEQSVIVDSERRQSMSQRSVDAQQAPNQTHPWRRPSANLSSQSPSVASPGHSAPADLANTSPSAQVSTFPAQPAEDPLLVQKRLMQEKRDAAIKRRNEEEAREKAEREERIRIKLQSMPPLEKKEKTPNASPLKSIPELAQTATESHKPAATKPLDARSPPKPPAPGPGVQQYGMIKVHPSPVPNGVSPALVSAVPAPPPEQTMERQSSGSGPSHANPLGELHPFGEPRASVKSALDLDHREKLPEEDSRWNMSQKAWERAGDAAGLSNTTNLWAPSGSLRSLGNGDFNLHAPRGGPFRQSQISPEQILPSPQAIAPPTFFGESKSPAQTLQSQQAGGFPRPYEAGGPFAKSSADGHPQPPTTQSRTPGLPSPLTHSLPPQHGLPPPNQLPSLPESKLGVSAWSNFSNNPAEHDAAARARMNQEAMMRMAETDSRGPPSSRMVTEKWKQTSSGDEAGSRRVVGVQTTTRAQLPGPPATQSIGIVSEEPRQPPVSMPPQHPKSSKFQPMFRQLHPGPAITSKSAPPPQRPASPPLPPPESSLHPAFDRTSNKPLVNLPGMAKNQDERPIPIVRLPPPKPLPQPSIRGENRMAANFLQGPAKPLAKTVDWQNRFNGLFNKERPRGESGDFSVSRPGFDILSVSEAAAVSFPQPGQISPTSPTMSKASVDSKSIDEEAALFDADLHPGSTPPVRVPTTKFAANWSPAVPAPNALKRTAQLEFRETDVSTCRIWVVGREDVYKGKVNVKVRLDGMAVPYHTLIPATFVKDSRPTRPHGAQQVQSHVKAPRKRKEPTALNNVSRQLAQASSGATTSTNNNPPQAAPVPQTWAKKVAAT